MDWGLGNPNKTAALIALLMTAVWALPLVKRWLFWAALPIFTGLGVCLMHTMSRGGFLATIAGMSAILWRLPRPWPRNHVRAVAIAVSIILVGAVMLQASTRFAQSWKDRSITNRFDIWKTVPRMMVDTPGNAYCSWYQPLDRTEEYRTLVNSHFTWLVEFSWPLRFLYIFGWLTVFILCLPRSRQVGFSVALGTWLVLFIASTFSSVGEEPWLWIIPGISLLAVLIARFRQRLWPTRQAWPFAAIVSLAMLVALYTTGVNTSSALQIHAALNGSVRVGGSAPKLWVLVNSSAAGHTYPRALREYYDATKNAPAIGLAASVSGLPDLGGCKLVVLGGCSHEEWQSLRGPIQQCEKLVLIAPNVVPAELNLASGILDKSTVVFGEFTQLFNVSAWSGIGQSQRIEGVGDFFQNWPEIIFGSSASQAAL